jgi:outer membrane protein TolC
MIEQICSAVLILSLLAIGVFSADKANAQPPGWQSPHPASPQSMGSGDRVAQLPQHGLQMRHQQLFPAPGLPENMPPATMPPATMAPSAMPLTLDQAIGMALQNNTGIQLATANTQAQQFATQVARSDYFPKMSASAGFLHFNENLGKALELDALGVTREFNIVEQDSTWAAVIVGQPITQLLTVNAAVQLAEADRRIAEAKLQGGRRDLAFGVTQLFIGLMGAQKARDATQLQLGVAQKAGDQGAARVATLQAQQALRQAQSQVTELQQQLCIILCLPIDAQLQLIEPPLPRPPNVNVEQAVMQALACSPEVQEARNGVAKAQAAIKIAKLSYVPAVNVVGGYVYQDVLTNIVNEQNIGFIGATASVPIFQGGKRPATSRQREMQMSMAQHNLRMVEDTVRLAVQKVHRDFEGAWQAVQAAHEILQISTDAAKTNRDAQAAKQLEGAIKQAQLGVMKAEAAYRIAHAQWTSVISGLGPPGSPS